MANSMRIPGSIRKSIRCCLAILTLFFNPLLSRAALEDLPADTVIGFEFKDTASTWSKWRNLSIAQALPDLLDAQSFENNLDYQQLELNRKKLERKLGFPLSARELFNNVFASGVFAITHMPNGNREVPGFILDMKVKNHAKASNLVTAIGEFARETTTPHANTADSPAPRKQKIADYEVIWCDSAHGSIGHSLTEDRLLISNAPQDLSSFLAPEAGSKKTGYSATLRKLAQAMPSPKGDIHGFADTAQLAGQNGVQMMMGGIRQTIGADGSQVYFSSNILIDGIETRLISNRNPDLIMPGSMAKGLQSISHIGERPLFALAFGLFNGQTSLSAIEQMGTTLQLMMSIPPDPSGNIFEGFEKATGISVRGGLIPAIGQEITLSINSFQINPMNSMPSPDMTVIIEVADEGKLKSVMSKLERYLEKRSDSIHPTTVQDPSQSPPTFRSINVGDTVIRTLDNRSPMLALSWALNGDMVLIGLNTDSIKSSIDRSNGEIPSFESTPFYAELKKGLIKDSKPYEFKAISVDRMVQELVITFLPLISMGVPKLAENQTAILDFCNQILLKIGTSAQLNAKTPDGMVSGYNKTQIK